MHKYSGGGACMHKCAIWGRKRRCSEFQHDNVHVLEGNSSELLVQKRNTSELTDWGYGLPSSLLHSRLASQNGYARPALADVWSERGARGLRREGLDETCTSGEGGPSAGARRPEPVPQISSHGVEGTACFVPEKDAKPHIGRGDDEKQL